MATASLKVCDLMKALLKAEGMNERYTRGDKEALAGITYGELFVTRNMLREVLENCNLVVEVRETIVTALMPFLTSQGLQGVASDSPKP